MNNERNPLSMAFIVEPPKDFAVRLINMLQRSCELSESDKKAVIHACKFIVEHNEESTIVEHSEEYIA